MPEEVSKPIFNETDLPDLLPLYYKRLFPHKHIYRWLSYGNCKYILGFPLFPSS